MFRRLIATAAVLVALAPAPPASAGFWSWGHNYMGSGVNEVVRSSWNYWLSMYLHKHGGDYLKYGYLNQWSKSCLAFADGYTEDWLSPDEVGCGGYLQNQLFYISGASSYLYVDNIA